jgi:hypothetical protein
MDIDFDKLTDEELMQKTFELNEKTMIAPPHMRVQVASLLRVYAMELNKRRQNDTDK